MLLLVDVDDAGKAPTYSVRRNPSGLAVTCLAKSLRDEKVHHTPRSRWRIGELKGRVGAAMGGAVDDESRGLVAPAVSRDL
jgi:hypothetical protein